MGVLTPRTSEYELIRRPGLYRGNQLKKRSSVRALIQYDWCPYKKEKIRTQRQTPTQGELCEDWSYAATAEELPEAGRHAWNSLFPSVCEEGWPPWLLSTDLESRAELARWPSSPTASPPPPHPHPHPWLPSADVQCLVLKLRPRLIWYKRKTPHFFGEFGPCSPLSSFIIRKSNTAEWGSWLLWYAKVIFYIQPLNRAAGNANKETFLRRRGRWAYGSQISQSVQITNRSKTDSKRLSKALS